MLKKSKEVIFILSFIVAALLITGDVFNELAYWWESWTLKWFLLSLILTTLLTARIWKNGHWSIALVFGYTLLTGICVFSGYGWGYFDGKSIIKVYEQQISCLWATASFLLFSFTFSGMSVFDLKRLYRMFGWLCFASIWFSLIMFAFPPHYRMYLGGPIGNPSQNMCFLLCLYPLFLGLKDFTTRSKVVTSIAMSALLLISHTLMPLLVLFGSYWAYLGSRKMIRKEAVAIFVGFTGLFSTIYYWFFPFVEFNSHGRYRVWKMIWNFVVDKPIARQLFGFGNGSATTMITMIQKSNGDNGKNHGFFLFGHNEWVQILLDMGYVGVLLYAIMAGFVLKWSFKTPTLFTATVGYLIMSIGNYPAHMALSAFFGMFLVVSALSNRTHSPV